MAMRLTILATALGLASASCPNSCSGHGTCGAEDTCTCYDNWVMGDQEGGDCSDRRCPYEVAWGAQPDVTGNVHTYQECAGVGICDRSTGDCECFEGYTGAGCGIMACPNDCSGHGSCDYIEDVSFGTVWGEYYDGNGALWTGLHDEAVFLQPKPNWEADKIRKCVCDPGYTEIDCSRRMCLAGNDILDERMNRNNVYKNQIQKMVLIGAGNRGYGTTQLDTETGPVWCKGPNMATENPDCFRDLIGKSFALTFTTKLNQSYTTIPIVLNNTNINPIDNVLSFKNHSEQGLSNAMEDALKSLPNYVIDDVTVDCELDFFDALDYHYGTLKQLSYENEWQLPALTCTFEFTGTSVMGPQNLLEVETSYCEDGCTPQLSDPVQLKSAFNLTEKHDQAFEVYSHVVEEQAADYNSYECGRRGKCDYSSGDCECFEGYTGDRCHTQTALI